MGRYREEMKNKRKPIQRCGYYPPAKGRPDNWNRRYVLYLLRKAWEEHQVTMGWYCELINDCYVVLKKEFVIPDFVGR